MIERSEAADALRQTILAARELSTKYLAEKEHRISAEHLIEQLHQAKANLATSTIEALQQERK